MCSPRKLGDEWSVCRSEILHALCLEGAKQPYFALDEWQAATAASLGYQPKDTAQAVARWLYGRLPWYGEVLVPQVVTSSVLRLLDWRSRRSIASRLATPLGCELLTLRPQLNGPHRPAGKSRAAILASPRDWED